MDLAYELATYLADNGFGTLGTDIYVDQIPEDVNGVWVERTGGQRNAYMPINETVLDILVKSKSASECATTLQQISNHIHRMHTTVTDKSFMYSILVIGDIQSVGRDLEYRKVRKITVSIINRELSLIS